MFTFTADRNKILTLILAASDAADANDDLMSEELMEEASRMVRNGLVGDATLGSYRNDISGTGGVSWEVYSTRDRAIIGEVYWTKAHGCLIVECCGEEI